jgi:hypothetical protein
MLRERRHGLISSCSRICFTCHSPSDCEDDCAEGATLSQEAQKPAAALASGKVLATIGLITPD